MRKNGKRKKDKGKCDGRHTETEREALTDGENNCSGAHLKCDFAFLPDSLYQLDTRYK
jgi:hypothetical protein